MCVFSGLPSAITIMKEMTIEICFLLLYIENLAIFDKKNSLGIIWKVFGFKTVFKS